MFKDWLEIRTGDVYGDFIYNNRLHSVHDILRAGMWYECDLLDENGALVS